MKTDTINSCSKNNSSDPLCFSKCDVMCFCRQRTTLTVKNCSWRRFGHWTSRQRTSLCRPLWNKEKV